MAAEEVVLLKSSPPLPTTLNLNSRVDSPRQALPGQGLLTPSQITLPAPISSLPGGSSEPLLSNTTTETATAAVVEEENGSTIPLGLLDIPYDEKDLFLKVESTNWTADSVEPEAEARPEDEKGCEKSSTGTKKKPCDICWEEYVPDQLHISLCGPRCSEVAKNIQHGVCQQCINKYLHCILDDVPFGLIPRLRCPICHRQAGVRQLYNEMTSSLLQSAVMPRLFAAIAVRCHQCHLNSSGVLAPFEDVCRKVESAEESLAEKISRARRELSKTPALGNKVLSFYAAYKRFTDCQATAEELYNALVEVTSGGTVDLNLVETLAMAMGDPERAAVFMHWYCRRNPKIYTACCEAPVCYSCHVEGHHEGVTCEDLLQMIDKDNAAAYGVETEDLVMQCPECDVRFVKGDGCTSLLCFCGEELDYDELMYKAIDRRNKERELARLSEKVKSQMRLWSQRARHKAFFSRQLAVSLQEYLLEARAKRLTRAIKEERCPFRQALLRYADYLRRRKTFRRKVLALLPYGRLDYLQRRRPISR